ncbi:hypothetical protein N7462_007557 [Penicillium macrosclerotiorum]|uniref:uncharacterized protein n=1 Tax=Penicillium macrosclerotiorum TaxID=303699 RepID=UPI0025482F17|nr:uncharacterized protein N7462_007557 [Penicillium macrosclerotiorum]KAJ5679313.1 hypothetical protein N7462_007557 [Penicillium macrosclerotiorum]
MDEMWAHIQQKSVTMGNQGSHTTDDSEQGRYKIILGDDDLIQSIPGPEGEDPESPNHVLDLKVTDWRTTAPCFDLGIDHSRTTVLFESHLDWIDDSVHFSFKLPADYPGGRAQVLKRVRQLCDGSKPLGITDIHLGKFAIGKHLSATKKGRKKKHQWTSGFWAYGCKINWLKRTESSKNVHFKFAAEEDEAVIFVVDETNPDFRSAVGTEMRKFMDIMVLPVRIWLRIRDLAKNYEKAKAERQGEVDAILTAAQGTAGLGPIVMSSQQDIQRNFATLLRRLNQASDTDDVGETEEVVDELTVSQSSQSQVTLHESHEELNEQSHEKLHEQLHEQSQRTDKDVDLGSTEEKPPGLKEKAAEQSTSVAPPVIEVDEAETQRRMQAKAEKHRQKKAAYKARKKAAKAQQALEEFGKTGSSGNEPSKQGEARDGEVSDAAGPLAVALPAHLSINSPASLTDSFTTAPFSPSSNSAVSTISDVAYSAS